MAAAQRARVTHAEHLQVEDLRVSILEVEGTVQLVWARQWHDKWTTLFNEFATPTTGDTLRSVAAAVDAAMARAGT